jgi:ElaB/YqjD/DUF883 family membrane-anchored ribosome-binding protein
MWNSDKESLKNTTDRLADQAETKTKKMSASAKANIDHVSDKAEALTDETRHQADSLVRSLKKLVNDYNETSNVSDIKNQITHKASELKTVISGEVAHAYNTGKEKASQVVQEHPVGTLALVASAGLLLGFVLGIKQSSK